MDKTASSNNFKSGLYKGWVGHRRLWPKPHNFRYRVFMCYLDLDELDKVLSLSPFWSKATFALARFNRKDYFGEANIDLKSAVKQKIKNQLDIDVRGSVRILTNLRYFGFIVNPLTIYYCFDESENLVALLLEVTNTPWGERHHYALACDPKSSMLRTSFDKVLHVSPFHEMNLEYQWESNAPGKDIAIHMKNMKKDDVDPATTRNTEPRSANKTLSRICIFEASMQLERTDISGKALNHVLFSYPFMTLKVFFSIYWQALKLFVKRIPFYNHPKNLTP